MPELPEVETIKLGLEKRIIGKKITDIEILVPKTFQGDKKEVIGKTVVGVWRRAKILGIELNGARGPAGLYPRPTSSLVNFAAGARRGTPASVTPRTENLMPPPASLLFHFKLTGQLVFVKDARHQTFGHPIPFAGTSLPAKSTAVVFEFNDGSKLFYNDVRKFGWIKIVDRKQATGDSEKIFGKLGPEPLEKEFTKEKFKELLKKYKKPIKQVLMDQEAIAGIGNIYANESLFMAGIDPRRSSNVLKAAEVSKLYKSLLDVLNLGIKYQGSSENAYVNVEGEKGFMQDHFKVYGKTGKDCPNNCGGKIKRIVVGGRGTFFCPSCQH